MRDRGVKPARFSVLVHTTMPAVLMEVGFVMGQKDATRRAHSSHSNLIFSITPYVRHCL